MILKSKAKSRAKGSERRGPAQMFYFILSRALFLSLVLSLSLPPVLS